MSPETERDVDAYLIGAGLSAEDGWDCAVIILSDVYSLLPSTDRGHALRDLIRIEVRRREAFERAFPRAAAQREQSQ